MMIKRINFIFLLILILLVSVTSCVKKNDIFIDNGEELIKIKAEIADTAGKRETGLMLREFLDEDEGMFFIFDSEYNHTFWMKNMLIPLDIIFISQDFDIIDIIYAEPCEKDPCERYRSTKAAKYVLEVKGNFTIKNDIHVGNKVIIE